MELPEKEKIIADHKDFIYRYTCFICKKKLDWENDDQLSIALIAFNEALDKYDPEVNDSLKSYAKIVIKNRLIDYFRQESRHEEISLEDKEDQEKHPLEIEAAWKNYQAELERRDRAYDIARFEELVSKFGITFDDLVKDSPSHNDTRQNLKKIAFLTSKNKKIVSKLFRTKKLPIKEIQKMTGASRKILDTWRKYLIAMIVILATDDLNNLRDYVYPKGETIYE